MFEYFFPTHQQYRPFLLALQCQFDSKDTFFIEAAQYTIVLEAYFVRVDQLLLVEFWDLKQ